ncbi:MAG: histidine kinase [Bacteroidales bacterium]|nr:histidine kinase [Bacteroidales bacterium]MCF8406028.1 histidine kinase [Bacteroidales bacterium]
MIKWISFTLCFFISLKLIGQLPAEEGIYLKFDNLNVKNGLSSNYILDILQDSKGYIWVATQNGLNRYDGFNFKSFFHNPGDSLSISSNLVTCLEQDDAGNLWIGTDKGLNRYTSGYFENSKNSGNPVLVNNNTNIRDILADEANILWIENTGGELSRNNTKSGENKIFSHNPPSMVNTYFYHTIVKSPDNKIWPGGRYMGLYSFDPIKEEFTKYPHGKNIPFAKRDEDVAIYFFDSQGTAWVGGIDGLYTFSPEKKTFVNVLPISTFDIVEDAQQQLWIGTGSGLFCLEKERDKFIFYTHADSRLNSICQNHINTLYLDRNENLWIGTTDGISIYRPAKNKFSQIYHIPGVENTLSSNHISSIVQDKKGNIWVGTDGEGVDYFSKNFEKIQTWSNNKTGPYHLASDRVSSIMIDTDNDVWIGQWTGRGFNIINPTSAKNQHFRFLESALHADWYNAFLESSDNKYWVGLWGAKGLYLFDKHNGEFEAEMFYSDNVANQPVHHLGFDGRYLWLGFNYQNKIYYFDTFKNKFGTCSKERYFPYEISKIEEISIAGKKVFLYTDKGIYGKDKIPFNEIVYLPNQDQKIVDNQAEISETIITKLKNVNIYSSVKTPDSNLWIGTSNGLFKIFKDTIIAQYSAKTQDPGLFPSDSIWDIAYQSPDTLWLGTPKGLVLMNMPLQSFQKIGFPEKKYITSRLISFLYEDHEAYIWIGTTDNGLNRLNPETGDIDHFISNTSDSLAFWGANASCITEDLSGNIWVGAFGLNKFNRKELTFTHYTTAEGLCDNDVKAIIADDSGNLWITTQNGLSKFNPLFGQFDNYSEEDGLQDNEFSKAACKLSGGTILFGGKNGLTYFKPKTIKKDHTPPPVEISAFRIFEKNYDHYLTSNGPIQLKYNQNYFSFDFVALDFSNPEKNNYAYQLESFDDEWIYTSALNRTARYTNVNPGKYIFNVKASNSDGTWNEKGISIPLLISPPYWKTPWFYTLEVFLIISAIILIIQYREKKIKEQNRYLALEQKLLRSQMNPHFIFNSLSSIQSFIFENNPITAGSYLSRFAELIRSILYNSREEFIPLEKEIKTLQHYLDLQQLRYNNKFDYELWIDPELDTEDTGIPPMLAQPFIENAIEHGLKNITWKGFLSVRFELDESFVKLIVSDNGLGIFSAKKQKDEKKKDHVSLATIITNERIEILNKNRKKNKYAMHIAEIKSADGKVKGTCVEIKLPTDNLKTGLKV